MRATILMLLLLGGLPALAQEIVDNSKRTVVIEDVSIVSMENDKVTDHQTVIVINGKIDRIVSGKAKAPKNALIVDGKGKFLMPGLAEMHAHVPPIDDLEPMKDVLMLFAVNGITTIRGMLGHPKHLELREMINKGEVLGPRLYTTGPSFNGISVTSPEAGAAMVRKQKQAGYDYLKLHPGLTRIKFDSIAAAAKQVGIPFAGHVSFGVGVWRAIEARYSSIDHLDGFVEALIPGIEQMNEQQTGLFGMNVGYLADESKIPALTKALKQNNVWVVPTQSLADRWVSPDFSADDYKNDPHAKYMNKKTSEQWITTKNNLVSNPVYDAEKVRKWVDLRRKLIKACQDEGVGLLLGCDAPQVFNVPGFSTHNELEYLVKAGLTPYQALLTGTRNVATYLGQKDAGVIRQGYVSNLILLEANPLSDITATKKIAGVMLGKNWMSREFIDAELKKRENR